MYGNPLPPASVLGVLRAVKRRSEGSALRLLDLHDLVLDEACVPLLEQLAAGGPESDADAADVALVAAGDGEADGAQVGLRVLHAGVLRGRGVPFWRGTAEEALLEREQQHPLNRLIAHMQRSNLRSLDLYQMIGNASEERFDGDRQREGIGAEQFARGLSVCYLLNGAEHRSRAGGG